MPAFRTDRENRSPQQYITLSRVLGMLISALQRFLFSRSPRRLLADIIGYTTLACKEVSKLGFLSVGKSMSRSNSQKLGGLSDTIISTDHQLLPFFIDGNIIIMRFL